MISKSAPARILVVDDDLRERQSVSAMVTALGYALETAEDGQEALEKLSAMPVDVIITDCAHGLRQHRQSYLHRA
jgi:CheY-like chemotaxis protein